MGPESIIDITSFHHGRRAFADRLARVRASETSMRRIVGAARFCRNKGASTTRPMALTDVDFDRARRLAISRIGGATRPANQSWRVDRLRCSVYT